MNLELKDEGADLNTYVNNGEWQLIGNNIEQSNYF